MFSEAVTDCAKKIIESVLDAAASPVSEARCGTETRTAIEALVSQTWNTVGMDRP